MTINEFQKRKIAEFIPTFKEYLVATDGVSDLQERHERNTLYENWLSPQGLQLMTELEFGQVVSSLWSSIMWGDKGILVERLIADNSLEKIKENLNLLLWGSGPVAIRYDTFRNAIKGFGTAYITELLAFMHPRDCGVWNIKGRKGLIALGFQETFPLVKHSQIKGIQYEKFNTLLKEIKAEADKHGLPDLDLLGFDYFLFELANKGGEVNPPITAPGPGTLSPGINNFDHDDIIEQIIAIGQWLGFEVHKEKLLVRGTKVDAMWQARIANLGVVTYVFEVQKSGSYDSLILNLQRAQNNHSVQRLVVVGPQRDLERIQGEIASLSEDFRRMVGYMDVADVLRASELVTELSGIINKLELVKSEYGR